MAKMVKIKNKASHYNHINFRGKYMYDFEGGEIKEVDPEVIPFIDKNKFEIISESKTKQTETKPKEEKKKKGRPKLKSLLKRK